MSPAGPASARGPEKWSDMVLSYHLRVPRSVGRLLQQRLQGRVFECILGGRVVEHLLEGLLEALGLLYLWHRRDHSVIEVGGRWGLNRLDDRLEMGAGRLHFLLKIRVIFVKVKRLHRCHKFFCLYGMLASSPESVRCQRSEWHRRRTGPIRSRSQRRT